MFRLLTAFEGTSFLLVGSAVIRYDDALALWTFFFEGRSYNQPDMQLVLTSLHTVISISQ